MSLWRRLIFTLTVCALPGLLTACGPGAVSEPQAPAPAEKPALEMRITWKVYSGRGEALQKIVDGYADAAGSPYRIVLRDGNEELADITADLDAGAADLYVLPYRYIRFLGDAGRLSDLTADTGDQQAAVAEALWELGTVKEKVYGVPWLGHAMALVYNRDLLRAAGVSAEAIQSRADFIRALEQVEAGTDARGIGLVGAAHNDLSWMVNQVITGNGVALTDPAGLEVTVDDPRAAEAIRFYRETLGAHAQESWLSDTGVEVMAHFRNQAVAFEIQGPWGVTDIWKNGRPFEVGAIPLSRIGLGAEVGPMMLALPRDIAPEKRAAALELIRYLLSPEAQAQVLDGEYSPEHDTYYPFRIPVRRDMAEALVQRQYPEFSAFIEGFGNPSIDVPAPRWQLVKDRLYTPGLHRVMTGEQTVEAFLDQIDKEGSAILQSQ